MSLLRRSLVLGALAAPFAAAAQAPPPGFVRRDPYAGRNKVLFVGDLRTGNQVAHDSVSHAMGVIEHLGRNGGDFVTFLRTDTDWVTKAETWGKGDYAKGGPKQAPGRNLDYFDAVVFYTNGETEMSEQQKQDLLSFVRDDGKGFVAIHTATATMTKWPAYGEMVGAYFDNHPWNTTSGRVIVERPDAAPMRGLPPSFPLTDEFYQYKAPYDRAKVDVLARLDLSDKDMTNKGVHRSDGDFPVAWIKTYGKGRVFSSGLGHSDAVWDDANVQAMYRQAIRWVLRLEQGEPRPHPMPK